MTEPSGDLEARVDALEERVDGLAEQLQRTKQDAIAARVLAGGADRDVGELGAEMRDFRQATVASFNAMREDLVGLRARVDDGFSHVDDGFSEVRHQLGTTAAGLTHITNLLNGLIGERGDNAAGPE